jgi:hypothetical protein
MGLQIPERSRKLVRVREMNKCLRCAMGSQALQWHHRRSRSVRDPHQHCPCNGVLLCPTCHEWVHKHPFEARGLGLIVSRHTAVPGTVPVWSHHHPALLLKCAGGFEFGKVEP